MTWDRRDLSRQQGRPGTADEAEIVPLPPMGPAAPARMPRLERAEQLLGRREETLSAEVRREMLQAGLVDEQTWAVWRRLMTRGVYEEG